MNEKEIAALLIGVVYPAMIALVAGLFTLLQVKLHKESRSSKKSFDHRVRK